MRQTLLLILKIAISAGLLYLAFQKIDLGELWSRLNSNSIGWLLLAVAVVILQIYASAVRWQKITAKCDAPLTLHQAMRFCMIGTFFNQVLPSSIGGDTVRLWLLKNTGVGWRNATYSVFIDRATGLIALAVMIGASLPFSFMLITDPQGRIALAAAVVIALSLGIGFLVLGRLTWPILKRWPLIHHPYNCSVISNELFFDRSNGPQLAALSILVHVLTGVTGWCVVRSIGAPIAFYQVFLLIPPVVMITMLPIAIAGWGVRETVMMVAFGYAALSPQDGISVSLLFGAVTFASGLIGGLVWILSTEKKAAGPVEPPPVLDI